VLAFIIAVKHPARSRSYEVVTDLLRRTLASVEAQTDKAFAVVVVCNKRPAWAVESGNRLFVEVDFPPAALPSSVNEEHAWVYLDKGAKNAVGLLHAKRFGPTHVMFVDADDFVSRRLAEHVRLNSSAPGWYFQRGLMYSGQFKIAEARENFSTYCGTSHILRRDLLPVEMDLAAAFSLDGVLAALDRTYVRRILGDHQDFVSYAAKRGQALAPLPFTGAVWHTETGENSSRMAWGQSRFGSIWGKPLSPAESEEFGIPLARRSVQESVLLHAWRLRSLAASGINRVLGRASRSEREFEARREVQRARKLSGD